MIYHIPEEISKMLGTYFDGFLMQFTTKEYTTNCNMVDVGIAMGCSVSPILFVVAMQLLLKVKAFMDDNKILSFKESTTHKILSLMDKQVIWCRMKFKPKKSRSLSPRKVKVNQNINFMVGGQRTPTVSEESVKKFGTLVWWVLERHSSIKRKKHREHYKKASKRLITVLYKENPRFGAFSIYLFRCCYDCYSYTIFRQVQ